MIEGEIFQFLTKEHEDKIISVVSEVLNREKELIKLKITPDNYLYGRDYIDSDFQSSMFEIRHFSSETGYTERILNFNLAPFRGQCGFYILCYVNVIHKLQKHGLGKLIFQEIAPYIGRRLNYTKLLATDVVYNTISNHMFESYGWEKWYSYVNKRTDNLCNCWMLDITNEE